jgi:hypothetical protein
MVTTHVTNEVSVAAVKEALAEESVVVDAPVSFRIFDPNKV